MRRSQVILFLALSRQLHSATKHLGWNQTTMPPFQCCLVSSQNCHYVSVWKLHTETGRQSDAIVPSFNRFYAVWPEPAQFVLAQGNWKQIKFARFLCVQSAANWIVSRPVGSRLMLSTREKERMRYSLQTCLHVTSRPSISISILAKKKIRDNTQWRKSSQGILTCGKASVCCVMLREVHVSVVFETRTKRRSTPVNSCRSAFGTLCWRARIKKSFLSYFYWSQFRLTIGEKSADWQGNGSDCRSCQAPWVAWIWWHQLQTGNKGTYASKYSTSVAVTCCGQNAIPGFVVFVWGYQG